MKIEQDTDSINKLLFVLTDGDLTQTELDKAEVLKQLKSEFWKAVDIADSSWVKKPFLKNHLVKKLMIICAGEERWP